MAKTADDDGYKEAIAGHYLMSYAVFDDQVADSGQIFCNCNLAISF